MEKFYLPEDLQYVFVAVGLFVVPKVLQRYRIPSAITSVSLGAVLGMGFDLLHGDTVIPLLSTLGIVALFLFAGLEVDFDEMKRGIKVTVGFLGVQVALLVMGTWIFAGTFSLSWRPALLFALAVFTPSAGFILDSIRTFGLSEQQQFWVKTKAIASELVALVALFFAVQSGSLRSLGLSSLALLVMFGLLPTIFYFFVSRILPFAPKSEFAFILILALICAYITRHLGVYYLVGAFVVGLTSVRLKKKLPELASERLLIGIDLFASFFIPFYFFKAGLHLEAQFFSPHAIVLGLALVAVAVPLRVGVVVAFRRLALGESWPESKHIGIALVPTLVFSLVLAEILREQFFLPPHLFGALVVFALVNTMLPGVFLQFAPSLFVTNVVSGNVLSSPQATSETS